MIDIRELQARRTTTGRIDQIGRYYVTGHYPRPLRQPIQTACAYCAPKNVMVKGRVLPVKSVFAVSHGICLSCLVEQKKLLKR